MEPEAVKFYRLNSHEGPPDVEVLATVSIAISLRRIADMLCGPEVQNTLDEISRYVQAMRTP